MRLIKQNKKIVMVILAFMLVAVFLPHTTTPAAFADDYASITVYKEGNGLFDAPGSTTLGANLEINVIPDEGNELLYLELNDREVTDQVVDNVYSMTVDTNDLTFRVIFQPMIEVTEGDGGEYAIGSGSNYHFTIDADLSEFGGSGLIMIDGEPINLLYDREVDADNRQIILLSSYLDTLELGEHTFEAIFPYPERGSARAVFSVVEAIDEGMTEEIEGEVESTSILVPSTGTYTGQDSNAQEATVAPIIAAISALATIGFVVKRQIRRAK